MCGVRLSSMPYDFAENEPESLTQSSSGRSDGPPRKHTGVDVLDPNDGTAAPARPANITFTVFLIIAILAIMAGIVFFLNR
jgi:hypothetical protein